MTKYNGQLPVRNFLVLPPQQPPGEPGETTGKDKVSKFGYIKLRFHKLVKSWMVKKRDKLVYIKHKSRMQQNSKFYVCVYLVWIHSHWTLLAPRYSVPGRCNKYRMLCIMQQCNIVILHAFPASITAWRVIFGTKHRNHRVRVALSINWIKTSPLANAAPDDLSK